MQVTLLSLVAALAALAQAIALTNTNFNVEAGKPFVITYAGNSGQPVTILLKSGPSDNLNTVDTLTTTSTDGSFTWTPPTTLPKDVYAFEIITAGQHANYSPQFPIDTNVQKSASSSTTSTETTASSTTGTSKTTTATTPTPTISLSRNNGTTTTSKKPDVSYSKATDQPTEEPTTVPSTNAAGNFASPLALVLGAVAALAFLN